MKRDEKIMQCQRTALEKLLLRDSELAHTHIDPRKWIYLITTKKMGSTERVRKRGHLWLAQGPHLHTWRHSRNCNRADSGSGPQGKVFHLGQSPKYDFRPDARRSSLEQHSCRPRPYTRPEAIIVAISNDNIK
ncbi:unnamed protein product [Protopolystoma xenopodis]|uniref:Uncharacterized protein n=1 Tax=Protopolystoma xenopodis TaxID=117903 RepID=A0A448WS40_9PLAT|nr:unnamed protein product [Protopolystoma xenopodis]